MPVKFTYLPVNLGCRLNQAELTQMELVFQKHGGRLDKNKPDLIVVNTCGVTAKAEKESRQTIRSLRRRFPKAKLIAWGCAADRWLKDVKTNWQDWGVDLIYGNQDKDGHPYKFLTLIQKPPVKQAPTKGFYTHRPRRFIKIQTGCNKFCSYCLIPLMRHFSQSKPADVVIDEIKRAQKDNVKEIILTGVDISSYGLSSPIRPKSWQDDDLTPLSLLLQRIIKETRIPRIRLGSINPASFNKSFILLFKHNPRLLPHFHISLQSGSDRILKLMNRRYSALDYARIVNRLQELVPEVLISTDVIVGFPTETEADFQATCDLVQQLGLSRLHVFPFSHRADTIIDKLKLKPVPAKVIKERAAQLRQIDLELRRQSQIRYQDKPVRVLWETYQDGHLKGWTHNYLPVIKTGSKDQVGQIETIIYNPPAAT